MHILIIFALLFFQVPKANPYHVWIIAGQSNAVGSAPMPARVPVIAGAVRVDAGGNWTPLREPAGIYKDAAYGFSSSFARAIIKHTGNRVAIINCAQGSSGIMQWQKGGTLYDTCMRLARGKTIDGIIFVQGEQDAKADGHYMDWCKHFRAMVWDFRTDLKSNTPIYLVALGDFPAPTSQLFPNWETVKRQQIMAGRLPHVFVVSADGLEKDWPGIHYTRAGYDALGRRVGMTKNFYDKLRRREYPPLGDLADAIYWQEMGDKEPMKAYLDAVSTVKVKYPKPV